jgi:hypothetical protein
MGIPLIFGVIHSFSTTSKEVPIEKPGKENISWILCNDFLVMLESNVKNFEHCIFFLVCICISLLKLCVFLQVFILHDGNLQSICTINFINFLWLFVIYCCRTEMFIFCLVPKT